MNIILATGYFYRGACAIFGGKFCKENYSFVTINKAKIYILIICVNVVVARQSYINTKDSTRMVQEEEMRTERPGEESPPGNENEKHDG